MIKNATSLTNTTIFVGTLEIMKNFASEHWEAITAIIVAIATCVGVAWMIFSSRSQRKHEREMEKLRQDYDEKIRQQPKQIATDRLKSRLERFVSCWEEDKESILERDEERGKKLRGKLFWIGNELKEEVKEDGKLVSLTISEGVNDIGDKIITFSHQIARRVIVVNEDVERTKRINQKKIEEGDKLIERVKEFIEKLQQEGEEEKGGKEDE
nr:hypothetical protein GZ27E6_36 [uncultured archaeon GZfos27E6]